ncbi:MAG: 2-hydroxyacyl-CoA dehydratase subunit D [Phycisphaerae bacterium]
MTIDETIQQCRDLLDLLPGEALARARERHPDVGGFGVFPVYAPVEIIHAAGLMPVGMFGAGNKVEISHADSRFQSFICSIAKSTLELFLRDEMKDFSGVVFSSICDVARNLASLVQRNVPDLYVEYLHMPQNLYSEGSIAYSRSEFQRFRNNLSKHLGRPITDEAIGKSLKLYNKARGLTRALYEHRKARPGSITAAELCTVVQAGTCMMPEDFVALLEPLVEQVRTRKTHSRDCVNVVVEGAFCEQPPIGLVEVIEAAGCQVRDDDMMIGWRLFKDDVCFNGDPMGALAEAYLKSSCYTSVRHDRDNPRAEQLMRRMEQAGADAVIFAPAKFCEPALLDYVLYRKRLDEGDVPHLKIEFEEKMWTFESTRTEVETFAESMLFD